MANKWTPTAGTYAVDAADSRIGEVRRLRGGNAYLVPPGGGAEWTVRTDQLRRPTDEEHARARMWTRPVGSRP